MSQVIRDDNVSGLALVWWTFTSDAAQARVRDLGGVLCVVTDWAGHVCLIEDEL
jgi:hypothetical protein